jgi:hypothetical protein
MLGRPLLVALLFLTLPLAGCIGAKDAPVDAAADDGTAQTPVQNDTLPTGQEFVAAEETTKTEEGFGGLHHMHDYWEGQEQVTIYDYDVPSSIFPTFERDDNTKVFLGFVNLNEVPGQEGTEEKPGRTAATDWSEWIPVEAGKPFEYTPRKIETDMPHSFRSLWNWKVQAVSPVPVTGAAFTDALTSTPLHVQITVTKSRDVDDWPGHPAFYDGVQERFVVRDAPGRTNVQQAADVLVYGVEPDQIVPDKLVSMGTRYLDVYVNITKLEMPPGIESDGFTLFWRSAATHPTDLGYNPGNNDTDGKTWAYWHLTVKDDELDSPYQPTSRFSFKVLANAADSTFARCYRCVPYTIEYTMTVIARPDPDAVAALDGMM